MPKDNGAMEVEPAKVESPERKRRWYQFSLRTLIIVVVPYVALYAMGMTAILSIDKRPPPPKTGWALLDEAREAARDIGHDFGDGIRQYWVIAFTLAWWLFLPILGLAVWRIVHVLRSRRATSFSINLPPGGN
jgi:hypothetical protein